MTMFIDHLQTNRVTLGTGPGDDFQPAVSLHLTTNNVKPIGSQIARLHVAFQGNLPAEVEIEPGPDCQAPAGSAIITQVQMWGKTTPDGTGRGRVTTGIYSDGQGGQYALLDSTTNDASMSEGQQRSLPLLINAGEGTGMYVGLYPGENALLVQDRMRSGNSRDWHQVRIPLRLLVFLLRAIGPLLRLIPSDPK
jgi:hypothetical protein